MLTLTEHSQRRAIVREMHLRRWPQIACPVTIIQVLRLLTQAEREHEQQRLRTAVSTQGRITSESSRHMRGYLGETLRFSWELHSEASTFTLFAVPGAGGAGQADTAALEQYLDVLRDLGGHVVRATRMFVVADEAAAETLLPEFAFKQAELVSCMVGTGAGVSARLWSDFRIDHTGFGNLLVAAEGVSSPDLARIAQKLQELGNYRNLALLGLPTAQSCWAALNAIELRMKEVATEVSSLGSVDEQLLQKITAVSLDLMAIGADADFRLSATAAYAQLVEERLEQLNLRAVAGYPSLADFTQRRLLPATRTCAAVAGRQTALAARAEQFSELLRTRVETKIGMQNAELLKSMEKSLNSQLHLQQVVEGLSVIAVSYYAVGLLAHVLDAVHPAWITPGQAVALLVPVILLTTAIIMRSLRKQLLM